MKQQAYQPGELRDEHDNIIRAGAYGKKTPFASATNDAILDYIMNNFDVLYSGLVANGIVYNEDGTAALPPDVQAALDNIKTATEEARNAAVESQNAAAASAKKAASSAATAADEAAAAKGAASAAASAAMAAENSATNAAQSESNAAGSAGVSKINADNAVLAKKAATDSATAAAQSEKKAKEYAEAAMAITQAQGTVYIDSEGYINILEVKADENTN